MGSIEHLVPRCPGNSSTTWNEKIKPILRKPTDPDDCGFDDFDIDLITSSFFSIDVEATSNAFDENSWDDETDYTKANMQLRQLVWILAVLLFHEEGWNNESNLKAARSFVRSSNGVGDGQHRIDESILDEMQYLAEAYKYLKSSDDKRELDRMLKALIEIG